MGNDNHGACIKTLLLDSTDYYLNDGTTTYYSSLHNTLTVTDLSLSTDDAVSLYHWMVLEDGYTSYHHPIYLS